MADDWCVRRPGGQVFVPDPETLQVVFANFSITLTGVSVVRVAELLLEQLTQPRERTALLDHVTQQSGCDRSFAEYVLEVLLRRRVATKAPRDAAPPVAADLFFEYLTTDVDAVRRDLRTTPVGLVWLDDGVLDPGDLLDRSGLELTTLAVRAGDKADEVLTRVEAEVTVGSVIAVWGLSYRGDLPARINRLAWGRGDRALFGACEGFVARVGPCVVPPGSACLECATSRLLSQAGSEELPASTSFRVAHVEQVPPPWPTHPLFVQTSFGHFLTELVRVVAHLTPQTIGGLLDYRFVDGGAERRPVHRVPGCPGCHAGAPSRLPSDATYPVPLRSAP